MAMKLKMPTAPKGSGGGKFTDRYKPTGGKFTVRVYPFDHEGENNLAAVDIVHFVGQGQAPVPCTGSGCVTCAESVAKKDKRLRRVTRFPMVVVDTDDDSKTPLRYDCPSSLYTRIKSLCEEDPDTVLGNKGMDIVVKHDSNADPANQYMASLKLKGNEILRISASEVPDLVKEVEDNRTQEVVENSEPDNNSEDEDLVKFKDPKTGKVKTGTDTGKRRGNMMVLEVDGHLVSVDPKHVQ